MCYDKRRSVVLRGEVIEMLVPFQESAIQEWQRLGRIFVATGERPWMCSHASVPTAMLLTPSCIRVFLAFRDATQRGRIGYVDVSAEDPTRILNVSATPCLDLGARGRFDEDGVTPLSLIVDGDRLLLFYAGWQRIESVRFALFTGLAVSHDSGLTFRRVADTPVLDRTHGEAACRTGAVVVRSRHEWLCYYLSGNDYISVHNKIVSRYALHLLRSGTPTSWPGPGKRVITPNAPVEVGCGRPCVLYEDGRWKMWLSVRTADHGYHIVYADSDDGEAWRRQDDVFHLTGEAGDWESREVGFASIVDTATGRYLFYNGNDYGLTGFGVARLMVP